VPQTRSIERFLGRLPADVAASFTPAQLAAIDLHFGMRHRARHAIDWRTRFGLPFLKFYFVVLAGREQNGG
jgi:hypothetical protein